MWLKACWQRLRAKLMAWHVPRGKIHSFSRGFPSPGRVAQLVGPQSMLGPFSRGRKVPRHFHCQPPFLYRDPFKSWGGGFAGGLQEPLCYSGMAIEATPPRGCTHVAACGSLLPSEAGTGVCLVHVRLLACTWQALGECVLKEWCGRWASFVL